MIIIRASKELDIYRIVLEASRNSPRPANAIYIGKAKPKGVIVYDLQEDLLPSIPGYLVYRIGRIEYPGVIVGIITFGNTRKEALESLSIAIEAYKDAVIKEEIK